LIIIFFTLNCSPNKQLENKSIMMNESKNISIQIMNLINISRPISVSELEKITGLQLIKASEQSDASFHHYEGKNTSPNADFSHVEFRQPNQKNSTKDGIVIATINTSKHKLTESIIIQKFDLPEFTPPEPRQQHNPMNYLSYPHNDGEISFAVPTSDENKWLKKIIIDYSE